MSVYKTVRDEAYAYSTWYVLYGLMFNWEIKNHLES